ncbi:MAG: D-cysteine desulfhydrase family protein [Chloroflexi bacterium]|nr:D-cysteine desulfhydrase family protein [Chloroflexota bacterium]
MPPLPVRPWPHLPLAALPTPVQFLPRLSQTLGLELWVKRDDLTGLAFGGNKTRKLAYLVAEALQQGADTLVTAGAAQSNHCRQTAAAAAQWGLRAVLVLAGEPQSPAEAGGNLALDALLGAQVVWTSWDERDQRLVETVEALRAEGRRPYLIPYGGSNALGARAYADALAELLDQLDPAPEVIVLASSSGGTQAGLVAGARLLGYTGIILGISVDQPAHALQKRVAALAEAALAHMGRSDLTVHPSEVLVDDTYAQPGYGVLTAAEREAITLAARLEGLLVDPVYTGRALAGLVDRARRGHLFGRRVVFWHTGGTPALFAQKYLPNLFHS